MKGIAKGANRSKKRFVNKLELFTLLRITFDKNSRNSLAFIREADLINSHLSLRSNISLYYSAEVIRELILMTSRELSGDEGLFDLTAWCLQALDQNSEHWPIVSLFLIRLMDIIGYRPDLSICSQCRQPLKRNSNYWFHSLSGTLTCNSCQKQPQSRSFQTLSQGTIRYMESAQKLPLERLHRLCPSKSNVKESVRAVHLYLRHLFQRDIHSWKVLSDMATSR